MLSLVELVLKTGLFQFVNVLQLFHLLLLQGLQLDTYLLPHLDVLPLGEVLIVQDVHIGHSLGLQIAFELSTPTS